MAITEGQEQLITLTYGQLSQIIEKAILEATEPLEERIEALEERADRQSSLIFDLRHPEIELQPMQRDRAEILRALLAAHGGKMLAKEARQKMHLSKSRFSELLTSMEDYIEKRPYHLDRTQNIIILKEISSVELGTLEEYNL
jgi:hypothetical protein